MVQWASARQRIDLSATTSALSAAATMGAAAENANHATPLLGYGFRDGLWPDRPERWMLEQNCPPDQPIALISNDLHTAWLNRAALHRVGLADHPTGLLREHECFSAVNRLSAVDPVVTDRWVTAAIRAAAARGVTSFLDFESGGNLGDWQRRAGAAALQARVIGAVYPAQLAETIEEGLRTGSVVPGTGGLVTVGPVKMFMDGSLNTRTALCQYPYPERMPADQQYGLLETDPGALEELMRHAWSHGLHTAVHALGDRANRIALDVFDLVGSAGRIEHAQLVDVADLPRFARPGLTLGVQPTHATDDRDVADRHWAGHTHRAFAYADLLKAGARLEIGSDAPVSPMDPWLGIAAAVTRTGADERAPWHPEQAISLSAALRAASGGRSAVALGDVADLLLCDEDPADLDPRELRTVPVAATLLGGAWTHRTF
jgi:predicted amidohydrolase YtcJ